VSAPDEDLARHIVDNQIDPQLRAARAREKGLDVETVFVDLTAGAPGWEVECLECGRKARLPFDPGTKVAMCPVCVRALDL